MSNKRDRRMDRMRDLMSVAYSWMNPEVPAGASTDEASVERCEEAKAMIDKEMRDIFPGDEMAIVGDGKTLDNTTASQAQDQVPDLKLLGNADVWQLICKASSASEGWMKSTKAMEIYGIGCLVQVTTQQGNQVAEAVTFVPGVRIFMRKNSEGVVVGRELERSPNDTP